MWGTCRIIVACSKRLQIGIGCMESIVTKITRISVLEYYLDKGLDFEQYVEKARRLLRMIELEICVLASGA